VSSNLRFDNPTPQKLIDELRSTNADVLNLQEVTPDWFRRFAHNGLLDSYPYDVIAAAPGPDGTAILSRLPLENPGVLVVRKDHLARACVVVGKRRFELVDVHPTAPTDFNTWDAQRRAITREVRALRGPLVVAGDFNATQFNPWLGELGSIGLRSAHELLGRGLATTWPNGTRMLPPIRIDHILVSAGVEPVTIREGRGAGSDHRPIVASIAIEDARVLRQAGGRR
jgi:endonuclease/exonuclease/phosphatase (EEP) superfamily protein YafD